MDNVHNLPCSPEEDTTIESSGNIIPETASSSNEQIEQPPSVSTHNKEKQPEEHEGTHIDHFQQVPDHSSESVETVSKVTFSENPGEQYSLDDPQYSVSQQLVKSAPESFDMQHSSEQLVGVLSQKVMEPPVVKFSQSEKKNSVPSVEAFQSPEIVSSTDFNLVRASQTQKETPPLQCIEKLVSECGENGKTGSPSKTSKSLDETGCDISTVSSADSNLVTLSQTQKETPLQCVEKSVSECGENGKIGSPSKTSTEVKVLVENSQGEEEEVFNISLDVGSDEEKAILRCGDEMNLNEDFSAESSISLLCKEDISYMPLDNTIPKKKRKYSDEENDTKTDTLASETFQNPKPSKILKGVGRRFGPPIFSGRSSGYYYLYTSVYNLCGQARENNLNLSHIECHINSILSWQPMERFFLSKVKDELLMLLGDDALSFSSKIDKYTHTDEESEPETEHEEVSTGSDGEKDGNESGQESKQSGNESGPDEEESGKETSPQEEQSGNESCSHAEQFGNESGPDEEESGKETSPQEEQSGKASGLQEKQSGKEKEHCYQVTSSHPVGENCENTQSSETSSDDDFYPEQNDNPTPSTPVFGQRAPTFSTPFAGMCTQAVETSGTQFASSGVIPSFSSFAHSQLPSPIKPVGGKAASYITPVETVRAREERNAERKQSPECTPCNKKQSTADTSSVPSDVSPSPSYKYIAASSEEKAADPGLMGHYYLTDQRKLVKLEVRLPKSAGKNVSSHKYIQLSFSHFHKPHCVLIN